MKYSLKRRLILFFVPRLVWFVMWALYLTCRRRFHIAPALKEKNVISVFWHGEFMLLPFIYSKLRKKPKAFVISSKHFHGEMTTRICACFKLETIRGSTNYNGIDRGGMSVLLESLRRLRAGWDMGITPDGPKGPYHSISDGTIVIAQKTKAPMSATRVIYHNCWTLPSWDRFQIPKPFSKIEYFMSEPFVLEETLSMEEAKAKITQKMQAYDKIAPFTS